MDTLVRLGDTLLGKYRVEHMLGQGGMGFVVAARHIELEELFAIKLLHPQALTDPGATARFLREARAAAQLKSEHVVRVVDVGRFETGTPYMIMEHLAGRDLAAILRSRRALPTEEAVTYVLQACEALSEAHAAGIVHRDLKPANLFLIQRPNGSMSLKVLDFGISKQVDPGGVGLTQTGMMLGSPLYMSPEQMASTKTVDARSDVWSMGVVFYQLVTGVLPFPGSSITEIVTRVIKEEPRPPSLVCSSLPAGLDAVVARALEKRPEQRFQSINELAAALRSLLETLAEPGSPGTAPDFRFERERDKAWLQMKEPPVALMPTPTLVGEAIDLARAPAPGRDATRILGMIVSLVALVVGVWLAHGSVAPGSPTSALSLMTTNPALPSTVPLSPEISAHPAALPPGEATSMPHVLPPAADPPPTGSMTTKPALGSDTPYELRRVSEVSDPWPTPAAPPPSAALPKPQPLAKSSFKPSSMGDLADPYNEVGAIPPSKPSKRPAPVRRTVVDDTSVFGDRK